MLKKQVVLSNKKNNMKKVRQLVIDFETYKTDYATLTSVYRHQNKRHFGLFDAEEGKKDNKQIIDWLENEASKGVFGAHKLLGYFYDNGVFTEKNPDKAIKYYSLAGNSGDYISQVELIYIYSTRLKSPIYWSSILNAQQEKSEQYDKLIYWYVKAVENSYHTDFIDERVKLKDHIISFNSACNLSSVYNIMGRDHAYNMLYRYNDYNKLSKEIVDLKEENSKLKEKVAKLEQDLKTQIEEAYAPGGVGYKSHKKHFYDTAQDLDVGLDVDL